MLSRQTMSELTDPFPESDDLSMPLPHLQALVKSVYSKMTQEEFGGEAANVSPGCRREMNEVRRRFRSGVADRSRSSDEFVRADWPPSARSVALDDVLDALRRASIEPPQARAENPAWTQGLARTRACGDEVFSADKPTRFHCYTASFAVEPFAFTLMKTGRAEAAAGAPRARGNELVISSNRLPLPIVAKTGWQEGRGWEEGRGTFWRMLCGWFERLTAPGAGASFRQNLLGGGVTSLRLVSFMRIGMASFGRVQSPHFTDMRAFLPRPHAGVAAGVSSADDSPS